MTRGLLSLLLVQPPLLWLLSRTSSSQLYVTRWRHLTLQQQRSKQSSMQWRLHGSPPEVTAHASSRVLLAELAHVAAAVALAVVEDFILPALQLLTRGICLCSNNGRTIKQAGAASCSPPEEVSHASSRIGLLSLLMLQPLLPWQWSKTSFFLLSTGR